MAEIHKLRERTMLPVEKAKGQIWLHDKFLCDVEYDISEPLKMTDHPPVQRITFTLDDEHCAPLLDTYDLTLVLADGRRCAIPRPLQRVGLGSLECYVESLS
jgi:hypothetical protein